MQITDGEKLVTPNQKYDLATVSSCKGASIARFNDATQFSSYALNTLRSHHISSDTTQK